MVPRSAPPLSWSAMPYRGDTNRFAGRRSGDRETGKTKAETGHERAGRAACEGAGGCEICGVFSTDAEGSEERLR